VTRFGVVALPTKLRRARGLKAVDQLTAETAAEGLLLLSSVTLPEPRYDHKRVREFDKAAAELDRSFQQEKKSARSG
jgi:bifunctional DNA-binding transcriptional regulator/antitoxin component of YhaV-PrlF toxin-antitoxin module